MAINEHTNLNRRNDMTKPDWDVELIERVALRVDGKKETWVIELSEEFSASLPERVQMTGWGMAFWKKLEEKLNG